MKVLIHGFQVKMRIDEVAKEINSAYSTVTPRNRLQIILKEKGGLRFFASLADKLTIPYFIHIANTESSVPKAVMGSHVLLVEDVCRTGESLKAMKNWVWSGSTPKSVKCVTLIDIHSDASTSNKEKKDFNCFSLDTKEKIFGFVVDENPSAEEIQSLGIDQQFYSLYCVDSVTH